MDNHELTEMWAYHDGTKHSVESVYRSGHRLEWAIMPRPFKVYPDLEPIPLPQDFTSSTRPALAALADRGTAAGDGPPLGRAALARLLYFSAGVLRRKTYAGGEIYFRAAACTGALYHIDLYLISGPLPDLEAGVYHFGPHDFALRRLRAGDHRAAVVAATAGEPAMAAAPVIVACTSTFWRNAWKYQARTYRHCFWDDGTLTANLLAAAAAVDLPARVVLGFVDDELNHLLDLDTEREVTLGLVALGRGAAPPPPAPPAPRLGLTTLPLSAREVDYPAIRHAHAASSLTTAKKVGAWRGPLAAPAFTPTRGLPGDWAARPDLYLIVQAVDGLDPGTYVLDREGEKLALLQVGDFRREAGHLGLGQALPAEAAACVYWLVDLKPVFERYGNRGYRAAQLEAALEGGKSYLAAYALRLGATGLTFFDDDVTRFFSPHAAGKSVMFLMAFGHPERRRAPTP